MITIIVPIYNEEKCLAQLEVELRDFLNKSPIHSEVLFVNDGSTDNSQNLIEEIITHDKRFHFIMLSQNGGLSNALKAGIDHIQTPWLGYLDSDLQTKPIDFITLMQSMPDYDLITGMRLKRNDGLVKKVTSKIANTVRNWVIQDHVADTGCPLKIIKTEIAQRIPFFKGMHRFLPALVILYGGKIKQVPIPHYPRFAGSSKYHLYNRLVNPFVDMLAFRWMKNRYIRYHINKQA